MSAPAPPLAYRLLLASSSAVWDPGSSSWLSSDAHPQIRQKWICNLWRPVGVAAASRNLVSLNNQGQPRASVLCLPSPAPAPTPNAPPHPQFQNPRGPLASSLCTGLGFLSQPRLLRSSSGDKAAWASPCCCYPGETVSNWLGTRRSVSLPLREGRNFSRFPPFQMEISASHSFLLLHPIPVPV